MAGYKMKTSHAGRNCQKVDDVAPALSIGYRMVSTQDRVVPILSRMALVDIAMAFAKLSELGGGTALDAPLHMAAATAAA